MEIEDNFTYPNSGWFFVTSHWLRGIGRRKLYVYELIQLGTFVPHLLMLK